MHREKKQPQLFVFPQEKQKGFTLLEVMVAVCIMAIGLIPLLVTHASTIRSFARSKEITHEGLLAESQIGYLEAQRPEEEMSESGQDQQYEFIQYQSRVTPAGSEGMFQAEVKVGITPGRRSSLVEGRPDVTLSTLLVNLKFGEEEEGTSKK